MISQHVIGVINLSLPLVVLYNIWPQFLMNLYGQLFCSSAIGLYIAYCGYVQMQKIERSLKYFPTGDYKIYFDDMILQCSLNPQDFIVRYAYSNETMAMALGKTIVVDPVLWHGLGQDEQACKVYDIFKKHIEHNLSDVAKERIQAVHNILTVPAQRFIFKHELAHVVHNFSYKKMMILFVIGFISSYIGIFTFKNIISFHGVVAAFLGMIVAGFIDLLLTLLSNFVWKLQEEKSADAFAVRYSNQEEIEAAAKFFENHQDILDRYPDKQSYVLMLPLSLRAGYQDGHTRSVYIRQLMKNIHSL